MHPDLSHCGVDPVTGLRTLLSRLVRNESGQILPFTALMLLVLLAMTGFAIDVGRALIARDQIQTTTDAAALAGGGTLPSSNAANVATQYSAVNGNLNATSALPGVTMVNGYPRIVCLSTLTAQGIACASPAGGNAVQVQQQIDLPTTFLKLIGINSVHLGAQATASATGSQRAPYNVAIIVDSTLSMNDTDSDSNCNSTRISCALNGVQVLLQNLSPCPSNLTTCGPATNGNVSNPVDRVALYAFPGIQYQSQTYLDYDCNSSTAPQGSYYNEYANSLYQYPVQPPYYKIVDYSTDYRVSNSATTLNSNSNLVRAIGGVPGCTGLQATIGYGTYFAGVIYAAAYDLYYLQQNNPGTENVLIILGDGDANAPQRFMPHADANSGNFASLSRECQQAVNMAQGAYQAFNMRVYSISYGAAASGCTTDNGAITPCQTMQQMASRPEYFYSDYTATGGSSSCISASHSTTNLNQIFTQIANDLSASRLISDNTS